MNESYRTEQKNSNEKRLLFSLLSKKPLKNPTLVHERAVAERRNRLQLDHQIGLAARHRNRVGSNDPVNRAVFGGNGLIGITGLGIVHIKRREAHRGFVAAELIAPAVLAVHEEAETAFAFGDVKSPDPEPRRQQLAQAPAQVLSIVERDNDGLH